MRIMKLSCTNMSNFYPTWAILDSIQESSAPISLLYELFCHSMSWQIYWSENRIANCWIGSMFTRRRLYPMRDDRWIFIKLRSNRIDKIGVWKFILSHHHVHVQVERYKEFQIVWKENEEKNYRSIELIFWWTLHGRTWKHHTEDNEYLTRAIWKKK